MAWLGHSVATAQHDKVQDHPLPPIVFSEKAGLSSSAPPSQKATLKWQLKFPNKLSLLVQAFLGLMRSALAP